jgi:acetate kinase
MEGLEFLGIVLDPARNTAHATVITRDDSLVKGRVIRTDEESEIARSTRAVLKT